jgi:hypothetical protein
LGIIKKHYKDDGTKEKLRTDIDMILDKINNYVK